MATAPDVVEEELDEWALQALDDSFLIEDARVSGELPDSRAADGAVLRSLLVDVSLGGSRLRSLTLTDVIVRDCDWSNVDVTGARLNRVVFERCRMTGVTFSEIEAQEVVFRGCALNLAMFRAARMFHVEFVDCRLLDADFYSAEIRFTRLSGCSLERAELEQTRLASVDLRGSVLDDLRGDLRALRGATIDTVQLAGLSMLIAAQLGITVED
jgi:uncharacterized protein YjbI with pentapeptide repeats